MTLDSIILNALKEDIGSGDHTTMATVAKNQTGKVQLIAKEDGVIAGIEVAKRIIELHDNSIELTPLKSDGEEIEMGDVIMYLEGSVWSLLSVERTLLNFMQRMSGIATYTRRLVELIDDLPTKILDTRKTTPQFRLIEKMAVRIGGGYNHRFGLYDMILIKDNHVDFAGGIVPALQSTIAYLIKNRLNLDIEIEVRNLDELKEVLDFGNVKRIMFDNFSPDLLAEAVQMVNKRFETEASGNIRHDNIRIYAQTGVDYISIGALTHHIRCLDLSLKAVV